MEVQRRNTDEAPPLRRRVDHARHPRQRGRVRAEVGVALRCGKCSKVLDWVNEAGFPDQYSDQPATSGGVLWGESPPTGLPLVVRDVAISIPCRARCGARYTVKHDRLSAAADAAREAGRRQVVLGVDV